MLFFQQVSVPSWSLVFRVPSFVPVPLPNNVWPFKNHSVVAWSFLVWSYTPKAQRDSPKPWVAVVKCPTKRKKKNYIPWKLSLPWIPPTNMSIPLIRIIDWIPFWGVTTTTAREHQERRRIALPIVGFYFANQVAEVNMAIVVGLRRERWIWTKSSNHEQQCEDENVEQQFAASLEEVGFIAQLFPTLDLCAQRTSGPVRIGLAFLFCETNGGLLFLLRKRSKILALHSFLRRHARTCHCCCLKIKYPYCTRMSLGKLRGLLARGSALTVELKESSCGPDSSLAARTA